MIRILKPINATTATPDSDTDVAVAIDQEDQVKEEELWKVIIHNDDHTSMEFVLYVLVRIFEKPIIFAEGIMMEAHNNGNAVVAALPLTEAQTRINKAMFAARLEGYPLKLTLEPA